MKKERFYAVVIIALLLLNLGTLGYLWRGKRHAPPPPPPPHGAHGDAGRIIVRELKLDEAQRKAFEEFKHKHRKSTDSLQRLIRQSQVALFGLVKQDVMDTVARDSLLNNIEQYEAAKHLVTIEHFGDIRSILRPEQKDLFNDLMEDIGTQITGPGRQGPPPPRRGR